MGKSLVSCFFDSRCSVMIRVIRVRGQLGFRVWVSYGDRCSGGGKRPTFDIHYKIRRPLSTEMARCKLYQWDDILYLYGASKQHIFQFKRLVGEEAWTQLSSRHWMKNAAASRWIKDCEFWAKQQNDATVVCQNVSSENIHHSLYYFFPYINL